MQYMGINMYKTCSVAVCDYKKIARIIFVK